MPMNMLPRQSARTNEFRGLNNVRRAEQLSLRWAAKAQNVDVDDNLNYIRRVGRTKLLNGDYTGALYCSTDDCFYATEGTTLYRINPELAEREAIYSLTAPYPLQHDEVNGFLYATNGVDRLVIRNAVVREWGLPLPASPRPERAATGELPPGVYQVAAVFEHEDGRESGASMISYIELTEPGSIVLHDIPQLDRARTAVYVSAPDGEVLYRVESTTDTLTQWAGPVAGQGRSLRTQGLYPPPPGEVVAFFQGRIYLAQKLDEDATAIWFSDALNYELFRLTEDYLLVPGTVRTMVATVAGLVIGTDREIWVWDGESLSRALSYGVPPGMPGTTTDEGMLVLWSDRGLITLGREGLSNATEEAVSPVPGDAATVAVVEEGGFRKAVVLIEEGGSPYNVRED